MARPDRTAALLALGLGPVFGPGDCSCDCTGERAAASRERGRVVEAVADLGLRDAGPDFVVRDPHRSIEWSVHDVHARTWDVSLSDSSAREAQVCADARGQQRGAADDSELWICFATRKEDAGWTVIATELAEDRSATGPARYPLRYYCPRDRFRTAASGACPICGTELAPMRACPSGAHVPPSWSCPAAGGDGAPAPRAPE